MKVINEMTSFNSLLDENILDDNISIDEVLVVLCKRIMHIGVVESAILVAIKNGDQIVLYDSSQQYPELEVLQNDLCLQKFEGNGPHLVSDINGQVYVFCQVTHGDSVFFSIKFIVSSSKNDMVMEIIRAIANKINIAFRYKEERRFDYAQKKLIEDFFSCDLATSEAWKVISRSAALFLPNYAPFKISPSPLCQVFTYKSGDKYIILRGGQEGEDISSNHNERIAIPLKLDETICGIPVERNMEFLLTDPSIEHKGRYQSYLYEKQIAKSELVFTMRSGTEIIAILNLEHPEKNVFTDYSVDSIRRATIVLSPFVKAIMEREERQRRKEISLLYVMTEILRRMGSMYRHKIGNLLLKSRLVTSRMLNSGSCSEKITKDLELLNVIIDDFDEKSKSFLSDLPNYIKYQNTGVMSSIKQAAKEIDAQNLEEKDKIKISIDKIDKEIYVFASQMLKEHIYNLMNNSVIAIKQRISNNFQKSGEIHVSIKRIEMTDTMSDSEKSPARIFIGISDNGGGVRKDSYPFVEKFGFTTRREMGGTGYGLPAAREYIQSVNGGQFKTINKEGEGFTVSFFLQEYDPCFHATKS